MIFSNLSVFSKLQFVGQIQPAFLSVNKISLAPGHALSMATMTEVSSCSLLREERVYGPQN